LKTEPSYKSSDNTSYSQTYAEPSRKIPPHSPQDVFNLYCTLFSQAIVLVSVDAILYLLSVNSVIVQQVLLGTWQSQGNKKSDTYLNALQGKMGRTSVLMNVRGAMAIPNSILSLPLLGKAINWQLSTIQLTI